MHTQYLMTIPSILPTITLPVTLPSFEHGFPVHRPPSMLGNSDGMQDTRIMRKEKEQIDNRDNEQQNMRETEKNTQQNNQDPEMNTENQQTGKMKWINGREL